MHRIKVDDNYVRTDLLLESDLKLKDIEEVDYDDIKVINNKRRGYNYTTIYFEDVTDSDSAKMVENVFIKELKKYIKLSEDDVFLIIGLGNSKSTPDSLGPQTIDKVMPTRYLFSLGDVEKGYSNVSTYKPDVIGNTGIESINIIKSIIKDIKPTKVIVVDALKASNLERLTKTIQITNRGIHPGSGINNNRGELSKKTIKCDVIAIGIPTVVDIKSILEEQNIKVDTSFIVTPTNIDFVTEKLSSLLANSINTTLHKNFNRQINK